MVRKDQTRNGVGWTAIELAGPALRHTAGAQRAEVSSGDNSS
jgi:hypothetical protein